MNRWGVIVLLLGVTGCAWYARHELDERYGPADPARYDRPRAGAQAAPAWQDAKAVLDSRCVVCHGCYDAPCQLQLGSFSGVTRGANKEAVYATRLSTAEPTRLYIDAHSNTEWRNKGFHPVLNEREPTEDANREGSLLYRFLAMKRTHGWQAGAVLPADRFDFALDSKPYCPTIEEFDRFEHQHPEWGMPYGLPPLSERQHQIVARWVEAGAPYRESQPPDPRYLSHVDRWEAFLNGDTLKARLASRYLYEHWFLAHLYFDDLKPTRYFELVRSRTPPGTPIDLIATRLPYDDPGVPRVYYRLRPVEGTLVAKTHMPYALNEGRLTRLTSWFLGSDYRVTALPSYVPAQAANPFITFAAIPAESRYRFLLDEAQYTIMGFIKGPVCRGQVALDVINDHFWVVFIDPAVALPDHDAAFLATNLKDLRVPNEEESRRAPLSSWFTYSESESRYLKAKSELLNRVLGNKKPPTLDLVWNGGGTNPNAALTVFRHFDSASVVKGFVGEDPETVWVIGYPLLERIHYLLVAGFDVYGNIGHQLHSRLYMNFLRMEAEFNTLALLPKASREAVRDHWYRDAGDNVKAYLDGTKAYFDQETGIRYRTDQPYPELLALLSKRLETVRERRHAPSMSRLQARALEHLRQLARLRGRAVSYLPEATFLTVREKRGRDHVFTVLRNSAHSNVAYLFNEERRRLPDEDTVTLVHGFIGAYPNAFYLVTAEQLPEFVDAVRGLASEEDYAALAARYAIRRTDDRFWSHSDALHAAYRSWAPIEAALFDYNRFENR